MRLLIYYYIYISISSDLVKLNNNFDILCNGLLPLYSYKEHGGNIYNTNIWTSVTNTSYMHIAIPVSSGDIISITANSNASLVLAFVKTYSPPISNSEVINFSEYEGFTTRLGISEGNTSNYIVPADATYIIIGTKWNGINTYPDEVYINGYKLSKNLKNNFRDILNRLNYAKPLHIEKLSTGFKVESGKIRLWFRKNGNNNIFNLYSGEYNNQTFFATSTDWFGPYRVSKNEGSGDFESLLTTGGNHNAVSDNVTVTTGETINFKGYCDGVECNNIGLYNADIFEMTWHNTIIAGNDVKLDGSSIPFLDEYYMVTIESGMKINVLCKIIPRYNGQLIWYSGLQFAGKSFAPNIYVPQYTNAILTTNTINENRIIGKEVDRYYAFGEQISLEMEIDRKFGLGINNKNVQLTGNASKAYLVLQNEYDDPLDLEANCVYSWRGSYHFFESI